VGKSPIRGVIRRGERFLCLADGTRLPDRFSGHGRAEPKKGIQVPEERYWDEVPESRTGVPGFGRPAALRLTRLSVEERCLMVANRRWLVAGRGKTGRGSRVPACGPGKVRCHSDRLTSLLGVFGTSGDAKIGPVELYRDGDCG
jgi:hypothetical protein